MNKLPIFKSFFMDTYPYRDFLNFNHGNDFFSNTYLDTMNCPKINVIEKDDKFFIYTATPGLSKEDLNISYEEGKLVIKGKSKQHDSKEYQGYTYDFTKYLSLDEKLVDVKKVNSSYENGELKVIIPKKEKNILKIKIN